MLFLLIISAQADPLECPLAPPPDSPPVLDVWRGELEGDPAPTPGPQPKATPSSVTVDEAWAGTVKPELRSTPTRAVHLKLGPPTVRDGDRLGWDAPYGCLLLRIEAGAVASVGVHKSPCAEAVRTAEPIVEEDPDAHP